MKVDKEAHDFMQALTDECSREIERRKTAEAERDHAWAANERDRTNVIDAVNDVSDAFKRRYWLLGESRGSYEWDDDRFRQEFRDAIAEFEPLIERLRKIGADRSDCPKTQAEVNAARSLPALLAETRKKALEEARPIIEGLLTAYIDNDEDGMTEHAEPIIAARAFLRSLSNDEAPK